MKYMILLMSNLISFLTVKPQTLEDQLVSIQNHYGIEAEAQLTEENIHHIPSYKGWSAYYENGEVYICDDTTKDCSKAELAFIIAHELYHHEQTLNIPTFEEDYKEHSKYYEHEANVNARDYVKEVYGKTIDITQFE